MPFQITGKVLPTTLLAVVVQFSPTYHLENPSGDGCFLELGVRHVAKQRSQYPRRITINQYIHPQKVVVKKKKKKAERLR